MRLDFEKSVQIIAVNQKRIYQNVKTQTYPLDSLKINHKLVPTGIVLFILELVFTIAQAGLLQRLPLKRMESLTLLLSIF